MTTGELLVELSELTTGTAEQHLLSIEDVVAGKPGDCNKVIYIPVDAAKGIMPKANLLQGSTKEENILGLSSNQEIKGSIEKDKPVTGTSQDDSTEGIAEKNNNVKGEEECQ